MLLGVAKVETLGNLIFQFKYAFAIFSRGWLAISVPNQQHTSV